MIAFYRKALTRLGHHVAVAENGQRLVELCSTVRPELVITDIQIPKMDGIEAIKQVWREQTLPVIVASGIEPGNMLGLAPPGRIVFFPKPFTLDKLEKAIALAVKQFRDRKTDAVA